MDFDIIVKNVKIIDGLKNRGYEGEVGLDGDMIKAVGGPGSLGSANAGLSIDGKGAVLSPGFIDIHSHDDIVAWDDAYNEPKLRQGVTTVVTGMCGSSLFPLPRNDASLLDDIKREKKWSGSSYPWTAGTFKEFAAQLQELNPAVNFVPAAGHGAMRIAAMGYSAREPSAGELKAMKCFLEEALKAGAVGMSTGLIYPPGSYARNGELSELAGVLADYGGIYFTHLRSEGVKMEEAFEEAARICSDAAVPLHIAHLKCLGRQTWGQAEKRLSLIEERAGRGLKVSWDQYPYTASSTGLLSLLPPSAQEDGVSGLLDNLKNRTFRERLAGEIAKKDLSWENFYMYAGGWDRIILSGAPGSEELEGLSIAELAEGAGKDPFPVVFDLIGKTRGSASMVVFSMSDDDVEAILAYPRTCIGSDGIPARGKVHPRLFGTFPRVLGLYAGEKRLLALEEAVRRMTSLPAGVLGLKDRGVIKEGCRGDMVIFNREAVRDAADYAEPRRYPEGITHVFVNGKAVILDGELKAERAGRVLLKA